MYKLSSQLGPGNYRITIECENQTDGSVVTIEVFGPDGKPEGGGVGPKTLSTRCSSWALRGGIKFLNDYYKYSVSYPERFELAVFDLQRQILENEAIDFKDDSPDPESFEQVITDLKQQFLKGEP